MRNGLFALALTASTLSFACGGPPPPAAASAADAGPAIKDINAVLDDFHEAAARGQESRYFAHFAEEAVFLGTDAGERWKLEDFRAWAKPHFAKGGWTLKSTRRVVTVSRGGDVAWFDEDLDSKSMGPVRGSGVMVRGGTEKRWRIAQYNLAFTVPNDKVPAVKKLIAGE